MAAHRRKRRAMTVLTAAGGFLFSIKTLVKRRPCKPHAPPTPALEREASMSPWSNQPFGQYLEGLASEHGLLRREW
jgi:hypothetical protein